MWKFQMGLATFTMSLQWILFSLSLIFNHKFEKIGFFIAIFWTIWTAFCYYNLKIKKNG